MAKFFGVIGYGVTVEKRPGVWEEDIVEREYFGDLTRNSRRLESASQVNDNVQISNEISIVTDPFARDNFHAMRYVVLQGTKWRITSVEVQYPRLILSIGGVWNEQE